MRQRGTSRPSKSWLWIRNRCVSHPLGRESSCQTHVIMRVNTPWRYGPTQSWPFVIASGTDARSWNCKNIWLRRSLKLCDSDLWDATPLSLVYGQRRFGGACCFHFTSLTTNHYFAECRLLGCGAVSVFRELGTLAATSSVQATRSWELSVLTRPTRRHIPDDDNLHNTRRENLKPYNRYFVCLVYSFAPKYGGTSSSEMAVSSGRLYGVPCQKYKSFPLEFCVLFFGDRHFLILELPMLLLSAVPLYRLHPIPFQQRGNINYGLKCKLYFCSYCKLSCCICLSIYVLKLVCSHRRWHWTYEV
jgi:hypothetical protein